MPGYFNLLFILLVYVPAYSQQKRQPYKDPSLSVDARVKDLLSRMTPEEKFFQLYMSPGEIKAGDEEKYKHGIFGFQVSASSKAEGETQQLLKYNTTEDALKLARKINATQKFLVEKTRLGIP